MPHNKKKNLQRNPLQGTIQLMTDLEKMMLHTDRRMLQREVEIQRAHDALEIDAPVDLHAECKRAERTHSRD